MISLGGNLGIGLAIRLHNQFSTQARAITNDFNSLYGNAQRVLKNNLQAAQQTGAAIGAAGALATKGFWDSTKEAMRFHYTLTSVGAVTDASAAKVEALQKQLMKLNIESVYGAKQLAEAAYELTKSGFNIEQASQAMKGISQFGAAGDMAQLGGKEGAAGIMAHTLNTFALRATDAERAADIMAYTANKSSADLTDFAQAVNYVGSEASILKIPLESVSAMLGVLANSGIRGTSAGVALANMLSYLGVAATKFRTKKQAGMLQALGIDPRSLLKANGDLKDMIDIVDIFRAAMAKKSSTEQIGILRGLMNIRGARAFIKLFQNPEIGDNFREFQDNIFGKAQGTTARIAKMKIETPFGQLEVLESTLENARILLGEHLIPLADKLIKGLIWGFDKVSKILKSPLGKPLTYLAAGLALAAAVGGTFVFVMSSIKLLTMTTGVSAKNMGRSLVWAWNSAAAAATRYALTARGVTWANPVTGQFVQKGKKGFQSARGLAGAAGGASWIGTIKNFVMNLAKGNGILARFFGIFRGLGGVAAGLVMALGTIIGWKNVFKGVLYGLGTLAQGLAFIYDFISNLGSGPIDAFSIASANFQRRQGIMREAMGFEKMNIESVARRTNVNPYENTTGLKEIMERQLSEMKKQKGDKGPAVAPVYLDQAKVGEQVRAKQYQELGNLLAPN